MLVNAILTGHDSHLVYTNHVATAVYAVAPTVLLNDTACIRPTPDHQSDFHRSESDLNPENRSGQPPKCNVDFLLKRSKDTCMIKFSRKFNQSKFNQFLLVYTVHFW